ncbi:DUF58 domain-containing protein [Pleionea sp. CnH1-48]|uniref:DUF58 domain-containing protein n=1 Tax=Pleionea sp. CnH1-48 TaxID=2954494 RepID=UPI0020972901|nr:DUF58 domain-containing protein [Pleionea sp. CnH1-48]MCO7224674.1 DUF58 domain-containing protein [Pleionea sp. CnH1-48]
MRPSRNLLLIVFAWLMWSALALTLAVVEKVMEWPHYSDWLLQGWSIFGVALLFIALADFVLMLLPTAVHAERSVSQSIPVDAKVKVKLKVVNREKYPIRVFVNDAYPEHCDTEGVPENQVIAGGEHLEFSYRLRALRRGDAHFGRVRLLLYSRLRLWQRLQRSGEEEVVKVYPNFATIHHFILLSADQQTVQMGIRQMQRRGEGMDFHQLREYRIGDSLRQIDWRATSRLHKLISKEYQEEKDQNVVFLLDCGRRMRTRDGQLSHFDHSLNAMLLLAYIALKQGDAVGMMSFGGQERWLPPKKGTQHINTMLNQAYDLHPHLNASDFIAVATELNRKIRKRSLVVLVSNFRDEDITELQPAIRMLNKHHLVLLANLREQVLDDVMEQPVESLDDAIRYAETVDYLKQRSQLREHFYREGVISVDSVPRQLASHIVNSYFEIKRSGKL